MKKLVAALILGGITVMTPIADGTAWASKNCPPGSHKGPGPDPKMIYCYDNGTGELVKIIRV